MGFWHEQLAGPTDPARDAGWGTDRQPRKGFFTDTSICIGCKACEVACKEWNTLPMDGDLSILGMSYDNTGDLGATTWRHVAFIEQTAERIADGPAIRTRAHRPRHARAADVGAPAGHPPAGHGPGREPRPAAGDHAHRPRHLGGQRGRGGPDALGTDPAVESGVDPGPPAPREAARPRSPRCRTSGG
jgi:ferredoxin